jgi:hypothetical protein
MRNAQMAALDKYTYQRYLTRLVQLVADEDRGSQDREQCTKLMAASHGYGLSTEFEVAAFVACGVAFGKEFDERSDLPFSAILREPGTASRLKAAQMMIALEQSPEDDESSQA